MKLFNQDKKVWGKALLGVALYLTCMAIAYAGSGGSSGLPWEGPLDKIVKSMTGPVALGVSILGMAAAGGSLVFGGELGEFTKKLIMLVLAIAFLVFGSAFLSTVFGVSGCLI